MSVDLFSMRVYSKDEVLEMLKREQGQLTCSAYSEEIGISASYLSDIYRGTREIGPKVLRFLRLEKQTTTKTVYVEVSK